MVAWNVCKAVGPGSSGRARGGAVRQTRCRGADLQFQYLIGRPRQRTGARQPECTHVTAAQHIRYLACVPLKRYLRRKEGSRWECKPRVVRRDIVSTDDTSVCASPVPWLAYQCLCVQQHVDEADDDLGYHIPGVDGEQVAHRAGRLRTVVHVHRVVEGWQS